MITKTLKTIQNSVIEFSEEELEKLSIMPNDKFSVHVNGNNIELHKFKEVEIDLDTYSKDFLIFIINDMAKKDMTPEEWFANVLNNMTSYYNEIEAKGIDWTQ